jgi:hypothetical protein
MNALLNPWFWFNPNPPPLMPAIQMFFLVLFVAMTVMGVAAYVVRFRPGLEKPTRRALERAGNGLLACGLSGLALVGVTYERVGYLSMRLWFLVLFIGLGFWAYRLYTFVWVEIPRMKAARQQQDEYNKWLPKRKNR